MNYYNDHEPFAAKWLENLIAAGLLPAGDVDSRDIQEVTAHDLNGYTQCHFFTGIGGWPLALHLAQWPATRPVWTGSCPCQPFSVAGKGKGVDDHRHIWPEFKRLIAECGPPVVFGEQVASKDGRKWLSGVRIDLEALGYGIGAADLCAAGISAPHIRQRLWWVAESSGSECHRGAESVGECGGTLYFTDRCGNGGMADSEELRRREEHTDDAGCRERIETKGQVGRAAEHRNDSRMGNPPCDDQFRARQSEQGSGQQSPARRSSPWGNHWIPCADGKTRRIKPGLAPLVDGLPGRVGLIRGYGNAICPEVGAEFITAFLAARP